MRHRFQVRRYLARIVWTACGLILLMSAVGICTNFAYVNWDGTHGAGLSGGACWAAWRHPTIGSSGLRCLGSSLWYIIENDEVLRLGFPASEWYSPPACRKSRVDCPGYAILPLSLPLFILLCPLVFVHWRGWRKRHHPCELKQSFGRCVGRVVGPIDRLYRESSRPRVVLTTRMLSFVFALALVGLWLQSYRGFGTKNGIVICGMDFVCDVHRGWLQFSYQQTGWTPFCQRSSIFLADVGYSWRFYARDCLSVRFPLGILILLSLAVAAYPLIPPFRMLSRKRRGLCVGCGYNLMGNTSGRCSECGRRIPAALDDAKMVRCETPKWIRIGVTVLVFPCAFAVGVWLVSLAGALLEALGLLRAIPEEPRIAIVMLFLLLFAYVLSRFVYSVLRWTLVEDFEAVGER